MPIPSLLAAALIGQVFPKFDEPERKAVVLVGWQDEMDSRNSWSPISIENKAFRAEPTKGVLFLGLDQVPPNWPYEFQWSGVTRDLSVDIGRFPVLLARVTQLQGYAHMDLDVLDEKGLVIRQLRSTTLLAPGLSVIDIGASLPSKTYPIRLRLIVGGPNSGCCATYDWVRFVGKKDAEVLRRHPDWKSIRLFEK